MRTDVRPLVAVGALALLGALLLMWMSFDQGIETAPLPEPVVTRAAAPVERPRVVARRASPPPPRPAPSRSAPPVVEATPAPEEPVAHDTALAVADEPPPEPVDDVPSPDSVELRAKLLDMRAAHLAHLLDDPSVEIHPDARARFEQMHERLLDELDAVEP